jgi:subtilisin-like proprotein convertase family protein
LEAISDRLMWRLAYRNFGTHESLVVNHTVDANGAGLAGVRWYELRDPGGSPFIYQQGTYAPDGNHRWMGSISMDRDGNIALGYSASSTSLFPSIRYTGRLASDPLGTLPQGEATLQAGGGSQTNADSPRWGDYSMMGIDPTDDCTFWYTQEYYSRTSSGTWQTRIGAFKFPSCGEGSPTPTVTGTPPTATPTFTPTVTRTPTLTGTPTATPACVIVYSSTGVPRPIPDLVPVSSTLTVNNGPTISSIEVVNLGIEHTWPEDMDVYLVSPAGTRVQLFTDICGGDPNWTQANTGFTLADGAAAVVGTTCPPGSGAYKPEGALAALIGQPSSGTWGFEITDDTPQDVGILHGWGLRLGSSEPCPSGTPTPPTFTPTTAPTDTPTPGGATPTPCTTVTLTGSISTGDPTQAGRLVRDSVPSTCLLPKVCPGLNDSDLRHYDAYTLTNTGATQACVVVQVQAPSCTGTNFIFSAAYQGSFDPNNLCDNYLADAGLSAANTSYSFNVSAGGTFVIVVHEVTPNTGCSNYTVTLSGLTTCPVTPTPTPGNILVGHVTWQGRPAQPHALQELPITLTLKSGASEVNYPSQSTDTSGRFTVTTGLPNGTYDWRVKGPKYLANAGSVALTGGNTQQEMGLMRAGDCNNDNVVNAVDFNILRATFGLSSGMPGYDERADFTGDQVVNAQDFNLLRGNFGTGGAPPLRPERR